MSRRAQVTMFVIIGIVLILVVAIAFSVRRAITAAEDDTLGKLASPTSDIELFVQRCLEAVADDAVHLVGLQGGYYLPEDESGFFPFNDLMLLYLSATPPTIPVVEQSMAWYVEDFFPECIDNFTSIEDNEYAITGGDPAVEAVIGEGVVTFTMEYPMTLTKLDQVKELSSFSARIFYPLKEKVEQSLDVMEMQRSSEDMPLGALVDAAIENGNTFEITYLDGGRVRYDLIYPGFPGEEPFTFTYIDTYDWPEEETYDVSVAPIPLFEVGVGERINHQVVASGEGLTFTDNSRYFDIDQETGMINFEVPEMLGGRETAIITVIDEHGNEAFTIMSVVLQ